MLISTLVSVILLTGLVLVVQSISLSSFMVLKRLTQTQERVMAQRAVRELSRPLLADAMINFDAAHSLKLNSTPYVATFDGYEVVVSAQDVNGLVDIYRTSDELARALLPADLVEVKQSVSKGEIAGQPFLQRFVQAGGSLASYPNPESWLTFRAKSRQLNLRTVREGYNELADEPVAKRGVQASSAVLRIAMSNPKPDAS